MSEATKRTLSPAAELYLWGFPTVSVHRTRLVLSSHHDTGTLRHVESLATPRDKAIVAVNNDTLYSSGWYDLSYGDVTIDVPAMDKPDRYWNVMACESRAVTSGARFNPPCSQNASTVNSPSV